MSEIESVPAPTKKPFPEDRAIKLALAREKALEVRRRNALVRKKAELEKMENLMNPPSIPETVVEDATIPSEPEPAPEVEETPISKVAPVKTKKKKRQMVVVEQSSSDSDDFEPSKNVVFVKRVRKKKVPEPPPRVPEQPSVIEQPPSPPSPPPPPKMTPEQQQFATMYNTMFNGSFLTGGRRR